MLKFMTGLLCGVGVGLLIAPAAGEQTRQQLMRAVQDPNAIVREKMQDVREKVGEVGANLGRQAAQQAMDKVTPESLNTSRDRAS
ncbi:MAG TPA: YtxH domain-containing protein [Candidatus Limnocylindrales bacterium]|jgi:gas vesicle protein|nr:YtxH domain-containing protein [Candidatus Limnocylindrales bacterium]